VSAIKWQKKRQRLTAGHRYFLLTFLSGPYNSTDAFSGYDEERENSKIKQKLRTAKRLGQEAAAKKVHIREEKKKKNPEKNGGWGFQPGKSNDLWWNAGRNVEKKKSFLGKR